MNPAFTFWLDYLDARGGLWERSGDAVLAVLPEQLAATHDLPESALITDDPDISREDGVLFLGAGHPEIARAAESVISTGDVSALTLPHRGQPLSTEDLLARIRELVAVDHGRIDATSAPIRAHRATVRLAALVTHTVSAQDQFTEVVECLVDVPTRIDWPEQVAGQLREAMTADVTPGRRLPADVITPALAAAHQVLDASSPPARTRNATPSWPGPASTTLRRWLPSTSAASAPIHSAQHCWTPGPRRRRPNVTGAWPRSRRSTVTSTICAPTASTWSTYPCGGWTPTSAAATAAGR